MVTGRVQGVGLCFRAAIDTGVDTDLAISEGFSSPSGEGIGKHLEFWACRTGPALGAYGVSHEDAGNIRPEALSRASKEGMSMKGTEGQEAGTYRLRLQPWPRRLLAKPYMC